MSARLVRSTKHPESGFALIVVIWAVGVIALLVLSFAVDARLRTEAAINLAGSAEAEELANAGVAIAIVAESRGNAESRRFPRDGTPVVCAMPQGAVAEIDIENEAGKIDINAASKRELAKVLGAVGARRPARVAASIVAFRTAASSQFAKNSAYVAAGRPFGAKRALFETTLELDQTLGVTPRLLRRLLPLTTVDSHRAGFNPVFAPPALVAALTGAPERDILALLRKPYPNHVDRNDPRLVETDAADFQSSANMVHVEAMTPDGGYFARNALIEARLVSAAPVVKEWRRGAAHYGDDLRRSLRHSIAEPAC